MKQQEAKFQIDEIIDFKEMYSFFLNTGMNSADFGSFEVIPDYDTDELDRRFIPDFDFKLEGYKLIFVDGECEDTFFGKHSQEDLNAVLENGKTREDFAASIGSTARLVVTDYDSDTSEVYYFKPKEEIK